MFSKISAQDVLVAHIYVCHQLGFPAELSNPATLKNLETQLNTNLSWFSPVELAAYVGLQITKQKPFSHANNATATALAMAILGSDKELKPKEISEALQSSSVVDEVADQLVLAGAE